MCRDVLVRVRDRRVRGRACAERDPKGAPPTECPHRMLSATSRGARARQPPIGIASAEQKARHESRARVARTREIALGLAAPLLVEICCTR